MAYEDTERSDDGGGMKGDIMEGSNKARHKGGGWIGGGGKKGKLMGQIGGRGGGVDT